MGGCYSSELNKPPAATRPAKRLQQSDQVILTELSDDDDNDDDDGVTDTRVKHDPTVTVYRGRNSNKVGVIQPIQREKVEKELRQLQKENNKELKKKQEMQLQEKLRQQKHNFNLQKEEQLRFKENREKIEAEVKKKQQELLQLETQRGYSKPMKPVEPREKRTTDITSSWSNDQISNNARLYTNKAGGTRRFNLSGVVNSGWGFEDMTLVEDLECEPEPTPPTYRKQDIVPNVTEFSVFDKHAVKATTQARSSTSSLVNYLKQGAENHFQLIRMFYRWITFNISFDVDGYYGDDMLQSVEADEVLQTGLTIAEGYANLFAALCRFEGIPVKVIHGVVKGYDYQVGDIINFTESHIMHHWNAVYINRNWFFVDCAWGAGHVDRKRIWHRQYQEFYFIIDPDKMIVDHFPLMEEDINGSIKWQLLTSPITAKTFNQRLKLERAALEWEVQPVTHTQHHIITVRQELTIELEEVGAVLEDYSVQFQRKDGSSNLEKFFFACKLNGRLLKITLRPPEQIDYVLNIFGQKSLDTAGKSELLVTYILKCVEIQRNLRHFPPNFRIYGAVPDYAQYGFCSDITKCCEYTCNTGEMVLPFKTKRDVSCLTKFEHIDEHKDITNYCLLSAKHRGISIKLRFPFLGYYRFTLFGKQNNDAGFRPVATFLIDCYQTSHVHCGFPVAFEAALELKCTLYKPLWKDLPSNSTIVIVMSCPNLARASVMYEDLSRDNEGVFEGTVATPPAGQPFTIYGQKSDNGPLIGLFHFSIF